MKLVLDKLLLQFILCVYIISDVSCSQLIEYSDNSALMTVEYNDSSFSTTVLVSSSTQPSKKRKPLKRRKRLRMKKKKHDLNQTTTVVPSKPSSTVLSPVKYVNERLTINKNQKPRKLRKRRKGRRKSPKGNVTSATTPSKSKVLSLESENLVFPITRTTITSGLKTASKIHRRRKNTRCSKNNGGCSHICHIKGRKKCSCFKGFSLTNDQHTCLDLNECLINNGHCQMNCTNNIGSFQCHCPHGLRLGMDSKSCEDINECLLRNGHGPCQDRCENTYGGYKCNCNSFRGTKLGDDLYSCVDIDECAKDNGGCSHICINTFGKSFCSCPEGMELSPDFKNCKDMNECDDENIKINCPNGCINTEGSYRCASMHDLQNDESYNEKACKPLFPPQNGFYKCSRKHALKTFSKTGRKRVKNSLGTKCILVCPEGFKRKGSGYRVSCGYGAQWIGKMDAKCVPI